MAHRTNWQHAMNTRWLYSLLGVILVLVLAVLASAPH
jgi:hypothetical protein